MRPLTGHRELFRRLNENNEARRRRTNEVREMGGLEPMEEIPRLNWNPLEFATQYIGYHPRDYQVRLYANATNRNHAIYNAEALRRAAEDYRERLEAELQDRFRQTFEERPIGIRPRVMTTNFEGIHPGIYHTAYAPRETIGYINGAVPTLNPCNEIIGEDFYSNKLRVEMREVSNQKLESNEDFTFLLNKD